MQLAAIVFNFSCFLSWNENLEGGGTETRESWSRVMVLHSAIYWDVIVTCLMNSLVI